MEPTASPAPSTKPQAASPASRFCLGRVDEGLRGVAGAQSVISELNTQRSAVTKLMLNYNPLGDEGVSHLFGYLSSTPGSRHPLTEICLNSTEVGCKGLQAISDYIRGNNVLMVLWLASNALLPDPAVFSSLASAINDSQLQFLSLTNNNRLGDALVTCFLPFLHSRHLHELHLNSIGMTAQSAPTIGAWISNTPQRNNDAMCHLYTFKCSGNRFGTSGVREIVRAIKTGNWSITKLDLHATGGPEIESTDAMKVAEQDLHKVMMRNGYLKRQTEKEALLLLRQSRPLLMHSKSPSQSSPQTATSSFPFYALPNELKLHILGLSAPLLSSTQCMRVCNYASDPSTLLPLLPPLRRDPGNECLADSDPSSLLGSSVGVQLTSGNQHCSGGKWIGAGNNSLLYRKKEVRKNFLEDTNCSVFEPERKSRG